MSVTFDTDSFPLYTITFSLHLHFSGILNSPCSMKPTTESEVLVLFILPASIPASLTTDRATASARNADIVTTGEGESDVQTLMGKAPYGVQKRCISAGVVTWLLSGAIDDPECVLSRHFANVRSINENDTRPLAQLLLPEVAKYNLKQTVKKIISGRE